MEMSVAPLKGLSKGSTNQNPAPEHRGRNH